MRNSTTSVSEIGGPHSSDSSEQLLVLVIMRFVPWPSLMQLKKKYSQQQQSDGELISYWEPLASSPGYSQILSRSCGEKLGEGLEPLLCLGPEMVDTVST